MQRAFFGRVNFVLGQLIVGDGVKPFDARGDIAIGNALHFKLVKADEIRDLLEADRRVVHKPYGGGLGHDRFVHPRHSLMRNPPGWRQIFPVAWGPGGTVWRCGFPLSGNLGAI